MSRTYKDVPATVWLLRNGVTLHDHLLLGKVIYTYVPLMRLVGEEVHWVINPEAAYPFFPHIIVHIKRYLFTYPDRCTEGEGTPQNVEPYSASIPCHPTFPAGYGGTTWWRGKPALKKASSRRHRSRNRQKVKKLLREYDTWLEVDDSKITWRKKSDKLW